MNKLHQELIRLGDRILSLSRSELYLSMRFLDLALSALSFDMNLQTRRIATDGVHLFFNTRYLADCYRENPTLVNRSYLHLILHGIFHHITGCGERDADDWNLACDMAVESIIDSMEYPCVRRLIPDRRQHFYDSLGISVFNAEQIYHRLTEMTPRDKMEMSAEFLVDDHQFWDTPEDEDEDQKKKEQQKGGPDENDPPPDRDEIEQKWNDISQKTQTSMETFHQKLNLMAGDLLTQLRIANRPRVDYKRFLEKFSVMREEVAIDPDSFDYAFYTYGLQLYDNIPLIEELEYREDKKIYDFVIAIDTSGSCTGELLHKFLEQTAAILLSQSSFFKTVNIRLIQCDANIQSDITITDIHQFEKLAELFEAKGDGDTDFRPVFDYVDNLILQQELTNLKGMIFFTDGYGIFPQKRPSYETAFIFFDDAYAEHLVPPWAIRVVLGSEDLINMNI